MVDLESDQKLESPWIRVYNPNASTPAPELFSLFELMSRGEV